jgi:competence protein ComEC
MKLPAVWIVAIFATGIALTSPLRRIPLPVWVGLTLLFLLSGAILLWRCRTRAAGFCALCAWAFLGGLAMRIEETPLPENHVSRLVVERRLDNSVPLRWRGLLRQDPERLPWGLRYAVELESVETEGQFLPVTGGLGISYFRDDRSSEPPADLRAGDRVEALVRARIPHNFGNPGAPDMRLNLARQGIHLTGSLRAGELLRKLEGPPLRLRHRLARIRGALLARLDEMFQAAPWSAAILRGMLLGDRSFIEQERIEAFQKSAAYHVLVIAGLHVAALVAFVVWAARRMRLGLLASTLLSLLVLAGYVSIVEDRPPILRAALMATAYLLARLLYRRVELLNSIAVAAFIVLVARPSAFADASFQLSFLAVGTIGGLAIPWIERTSGPYRRALAHLSDVTRDAAHPPRAVQFRLDLRALSAWLSRRVPQRWATHAPRLVALPCRAGIGLWDIVLLSATIQLGMSPLLAHYFHRVSLVGPLANIPAVVLAGLIVPLGFLTLGASFLWRALGAVMSRALTWLVAALAASTEWCSTLSWSSYRIPGPPLWLLAACLITLAGMAAAARSTRRRAEWLLLGPLVLLLSSVAIYPFAPRLERGKLEVTVLDVGQGDSLFVAFPGGRTMLIDGGGALGLNYGGAVRTGVDPGEQVVSPYLWQRGVKRLDVVALTHAHQDHIGGLLAVLENFRVGELWIGREANSQAYRALIAMARARGVRVVHHIQGDVITWNVIEDEVLWPTSTESSETPKNDDSFVLRLVFGKTAMLLPGDIERPVENNLEGAPYLLSADFLKVAHHGSRTSTTPAWLAQVHPTVAAISSGENNPFGHPHPEVVDRLEAAGIRVMRTDRDGAITVRSDGKAISVHTFLNPNQH